MARTRKPAASPFRTASHDHRSCIDDALDRAAQLCTAQRARLTPLRRHVLKLVWRGHEPVGAYAVLEGLRRSHSGAAPPTVYRALDFLMAHGLIHRIESLNAFVACLDSAHPHESQFVICSDCGSTEELHDETIVASIRRHGRSLGFKIDSQVVEVRGVCAACQGAMR